MNEKPERYVEVKWPDLLGQGLWFLVSRSGPPCTNRVPPGQAVIVFSSEAAARRYISTAPADHPVHKAICRIPPEILAAKLREWQRHDRLHLLDFPLMQEDVMASEEYPAQVLPIQDALDYLEGRWPTLARDGQNRTG